MHSPLFLAQITYQNNRLDLIDTATVGIFSTSEKAQEAITNISEGTLSVSFDAEVLSSSITEFELDKSIEEPPQISPNEIPF